MKKFKPLAASLFAGLVLLGLTGCDRINQAATEAVEQARKSVIQVLDEAQQSGSLEHARQAVSETLIEARQQAAGHLDEAIEYLLQEQQQDTPAATDSNTITEL